MGLSPFESVVLGQHDKSSAKSSLDSGPMSFEDYYGPNAYSVWGNIANFFTGNRTQAEKDYQNYLSEYQYKQNQQASAKANLETWNREDNQVQRLVKDIEKAGLNPWLALQGGSLGSIASASEAQKAEYSRTKYNESKAESSLINSAMKILALILLKRIF